jgi:hypothetical protein
MHQGLRLALTTFSTLSLILACSTKNSLQPDAGANTGKPTCASEAANPSLTKNGYAACTQCQLPPITPPGSCSEADPIDACCDFVAAPTTALQRAVGLHYFSGTDPNAVDVTCLDTPPAKGTPQTVAITGYVKLFSTGNDSAGVKIELFQEGTNGALGPLVGTAVVTKDTDPFMTPKPSWLQSCPADGCTLRQYTYPGVPTETPLIIRTSDASGGTTWAQLYDYNIYFSNTVVGQNGAGPGQVYYEASTVAATDLNTVASAAGGVTIKSDKGLLAGEVHDCGDVRLANAMVNTDYRPEGSILYFGSNESNPLPDKTQVGTSQLGLFGAFNYPTGVPIRVSAIGEYQNATVLVGTYIVQAYPGAVTALSLRGRRPFQQ